MGSVDDLQRLGLVVGRVVEASDHPGARGPSCLLTVDLGPAGRREATVPLPATQRDELIGTQVICVPGDELLVLAAHSHARGLVLVRPETEVEDGSVVA